MRTITGLFVLMFLSACCSPQYEPDGTRIDPKSVAPIEKWVQTKTHIKVPNEPVIIASTSELYLLMRLTDTPNEERAIGLYTPGKIVLANFIWDQNSVLARACSSRAVVSQETVSM
jgi:hypothetical protein